MSGGGGEAKTSGQGGKIVWEKRSLGRKTCHMIVEEKKRTVSTVPFWVERRRKGGIPVSPLCKKRKGGRERGWGFQKEGT